jgi:hypothetical protein
VYARVLSSRQSPEDHSKANCSAWRAYREAGTKLGASTARPRSPLAYKDFIITDIFYIHLTIPLGRSGRQVSVKETAHRPGVPRYCANSNLSHLVRWTDRYVNLLNKPHIILFTDRSRNCIQINLNNKICH